MPALMDLTQVQLGHESSDAWGCDVAPTVKLMGVDECTITPIMTQEQIGEKRGSLAPAFVDIRTMEEGSASLGGSVLYQDIPYLLNGLFGRADDSDDAAVSTDANGTITRVYNAPLTTYDTDLNNPVSYTLIYGQETTAGSSDTVSLEGATMNSLSISGEDGAPWRFTAGMIGKSVQVDALDTSLADRTVEVVMGDQTAIYIDPSTDSVGTTQISNTGFQFELNLSANRTLIRHLGNLTPDDYADHKWTGNLDLMLELDSNSEAYLNTALSTGSAFERVIRIEGTTGSGATARRARFDFNGVLSQAPVLFTDEDGVITVELSMAGQYHSTLGNWCIFNILNDVADLA